MADAMRARASIVDAHDLVNRWLVKADGDLRAAELLRGSPDTILPSTVGYHAQQAVEKYLKTVIVANGDEPPREHSIRKLWVRIRGMPRVLHVPLTHFAVLDRYPKLGDATSDEPAWQEVDEAIRVAGLVRQAVLGFINATDKPGVSGG